MEQSFQTQNRQLAFALMVAGCTFAPIEQDGPAMNSYTPGFVRQPQFGNLITKGMSLDAAGAVLLRNRVPGIVTYFFLKNAAFYEAYESWVALEKEFAEAKSIGREPKIPEVSAADVMRSLYVAQHRQTKESFANVVFKNRKLQIINAMTGKEESEKDAEGRTIRTVEGSGAAWTIGSKSAKKKFGFK